MVSPDQEHLKKTNIVNDSIVHSHAMFTLEWFPRTHTKTYRTPTFN